MAAVIGGASNERREQEAPKREEQRDEVQQKVKPMEQSRQAFYKKLMCAAGAVAVLVVGGVVLMSKSSTQGRRGAGAPNRRPPSLPIEHNLHLEETDSKSDSLEDALRVLEHGGPTARRGAAFAEKVGDVNPLDGLDAASDPLERLLGTRVPKAAKTKGEDIKAAKKIVKDALKKMEGTGAKSAKKSKTSKINKALDNLEALSGEGEASDKEDSHTDFVKLLKEEHEKKPEHDIATVKEEFKKEYSGEARGLMCSGCKLIAARFGSEIDEHDVHEQEAPALMLGAKRRAIDAACKSFRHLDVVQSGSAGPRFEAVDAPDGAEGEKKRIGQRLCMAVLEEARFDVLAKMMQHKVPSMSHVGAAPGTNWERFLCAQKTRLCKRREVRDDEDDEEL